ncbi:MAG: hypothetical protein LC624_01030, partial [Halobacteriales archaeon]|nr:hypothetical protein [Halobacteriales archaeon]
MRTPALLVLLVALSALAAPLLPTGLAAAPNPLGFNGSDLRTQVTAASMDGSGSFGAVAMVDAPTAIPPAGDTSVWSLRGSGGKAWDAIDDDLLNEGAKLVKVANGTTSGSGGDWVITANRTQTNLDVLSGYRTAGGCNLCRVSWIYNQTNGQINGLDINVDGRLIAIASGTSAAQNASYILLKNEFTSVPPKVLYRVDA